MNNHIVIAYFHQPDLGFGNQAVANVFGSNTFNICIGLGLQWVIYISIIGFEPYHHLERPRERRHSIVNFSLGRSATGICCIDDIVNFVLVKWHANLFIGLYLVYIVYAIG